LRTYAKNNKFLTPPLPPQIEKDISQMKNIFLLLFFQQSFISTSKKCIYWEGKYIYFLLNCKIDYL